MVAPQSCSTPAVAPFAHGSSTDVLRTRSGGRSPADRMRPSVASTPQVADEVRPDAVREPAADLGHALLDPGVAACRDADGRRGERLAARVPGAARAEEQRHLDPVLAAELGHLVELGVGQHHHARALRDPAHGNAARRGLRQHGAHHAGPLDGRDLDPVAEPVGEAQVAHRPQNVSNAAGSLGSASTSCTSPSSIRKSSTWSSSSRRPLRSPLARYSAAARSSEARTSMREDEYVPPVSFGRRPRNAKISSRPRERPRHRAVARARSRSRRRRRRRAARSPASARTRRRCGGRGPRSQRGPRLASQRSISPSTCLRCASPKSYSAQQSPRLGRVVVRDRRLEPLALRRRLAQLPAQPAEQAHRLLVGRLRHRPSAYVREAIPPFRRVHGEDSLSRL